MDWFALGGWTILIAVAAPSAGVLVFLRIVATGLEASEAALRRMEKRWQRERKLRQAAAADQPLEQPVEKVA